MKYTVDCWAHVHYLVEVEAENKEEAAQLAKNGCGKTEASFECLDIGSSGVTSVADEKGITTYME